MIGQKTFFHVSEMLKEAKPHRASEPFGGLTVVLLGDWKQLPPVFDSPLYHNLCGSKSRTKAGAAGYNVYWLFKDVIFFNQIERQAGEDQSLFRNELCRLSEGTFSEQDWQRWKKRDLHLLSREKQKLFLEKAVLACAYKKDMVRHNIEKVKANNQPIALIKAESKPKGEANKTSAERDSGLTSVIALSKDTVFRLSYVPKSVPICPVQRTWISNKIHCSRTMLPIILGYALSIHKLQGSTLDKVILNASLKEFALGLLFVGASRVKRFEDLTFEPFPNFERFPQIAKCTSLKERLQEEERMKKQEENTITLLQVPLEDAQQAAKVHAESINQPQEYPAKSSSMPVDVQCACAMDEIEEMEVIEDITSSPEVLELSVDQPCQDLTPSLIVLKGIDNLGNTCYMNCILQCLFHVNTVSEYFCYQESFPDGIAKQFAILLSKYWFCPQRTLHPTELKNAIDMLHNGFRGHSQHDAHEFLMFLRAQLDEHAPMIAPTYNVAIETKITCSICHTESIPQTQALPDLSLPIPQWSRFQQVLSLTECLSHFLESTVEWHFPGCGQLSRCQQQLSIVTSPDTLILHLKRFQQDPETLELKKMSSL
ncbi:hypothetical protein ACOMHN_051665 [Nucella lapillus]